MTYSPIQPAAGFLSMARPSGRVEKRTVQVTRSVINGIALAAKLKKTPLDVMLARMSGDAWAMALTREQVEMAVAAAPYVHPKLAAVAYMPPSDHRAEQRRDMLRGLGYHQRQAILDILATAQVQQIEGAAEAAEDSSSEEPKR